MEDEELQNFIANLDYTDIDGNKIKILNSFDFNSKGKYAEFAKYETLDKIWIFYQFKNKNINVFMNKLYKSLL